MKLSIHANSAEELALKIRELALVFGASPEGNAEKSTTSPTAGNVTPYYLSASVGAGPRGLLEASNRSLITPVYLVFLKFLESLLERLRDDMKAVRAVDDSKLAATCLDRSIHHVVLNHDPNRAFRIALNLPD